MAGNTPVHRCDTRIKLALLLAFTIVVFLVHTWWELLALVAVVVACCVIAKLPAGVLNRMLVPVYVLALFSMLFNVIADPSIIGLARGAFFAVRMIVLVAASFVVCLTTSSSELLSAFSKIIRPLRAVHVPVDDVALTLSLSVRFIPVIEREFALIRAAQIARGAESAGSFRQKLSLWGTAFTALFVGLFRHADSLALAMDARCYGAVSARTQLSPDATDNS